MPVGQFISKGIGSPAGIPQFLLGGLSSSLTPNPITTGEFSELAIESSILKYFDDNWPESSTPVNIDNEPFDWENSSEAVEIEVSMLDSTPRRKQNLEFQFIVVRVQCWAKRGVNAYRADELSDYVVTLLEHQEVPIYDYDSSSDDPVGMARFREAVTTDLSRKMEEQNITKARRVMVEVPALCQALPTS